MTVLWIGVVLVAVGAYTWKILGLSVPQVVLDHRITIQVAGFIPVALLSALVVVQTVADGTDLVFDARLIGLSVAAILLALRVPFLPMMLAAAASTALFRFLFWY
mgnify:FL=1